MVTPKFLPSSGNSSPAPAGGSPFNTSPAPAPRVSPSTANLGLANIRSMQQEIIDFHDELQNSVFTKAGAQDFHKGYEPFLRYILDNYAKQSGFNITQYVTNNPSAAVTGRSGEADSWRNAYAWGMRQLLDSLNKVGQHISTDETKPDGFWGILTNRALQNIAAFAYSMIQLAKDIKLKNVEYTEENLADFKKMIPEDPKDPNGTVGDVSNAPKITAHLKKIREMWKAFKDQVFEPSGEYGKETGQMVGFPAKIETQAGPLSQELLEIYNKNKDNSAYPKDAGGRPVNPISRWREMYDKSVGTIPSDLSQTDTTEIYQPGKPYSKPVNVTVGDLSDFERFKKLLQSNNIRFNNKSAFNDLPGTIAKIKEKLLGAH